MSEEILKIRGRLSSEEMTATSQILEKDASPISFKPRDDPDAPPTLQLQEEIQIFNESEDQKTIQQKTNLQLDSPKRSRTKSEDNQYTILGFLEKKIRIRIMSEQFSNKMVIFDVKQ